MKLSELSSAGRSLPLPLTLLLPKEELVLFNLLRTLPNQRYVAKAQWQDKTVLAKLFVGEKAAKHYERELKGVLLLAKQYINTPTLLTHQLSEEGGYLLFDYLTPNITLDECWQPLANQPFLSTPQQQLLEKALKAIATLHRQGLWQQDLHLDNLLEHNQQLYWIDGDGIRSHATLGEPLAAEEAIHNLAIFFAQLPVLLEEYLPSLLQYYQQQNPTVIISQDKLIPAIKKIRQWRVKDILKKIRRDCSLFSVKNTAQGFCGVLRSQQETLAPLLADPDAYIAQGNFIKGFGTTNVTDNIVNHQHIVLKRYNIKNVKHRLSRFWRSTRGWHSWEEGFRLQMLGIPTAAPLALIEERCCWLRGRAWLITEFLEGPNLLTHLKPYEHTTLPKMELNALLELFSLLIENRISHGDLKGTNLFWVNNRWVLIDLDAVKQHPCQHSFKKAYAKDRARFLRNWPKTSNLYQLLNQKLPII